MLSKSRGWGWGWAKESRLNRCKCSCHLSHWAFSRLGFVCIPQLLWRRKRSRRMVLNTRESHILESALWNCLLVPLVDTGSSRKSCLKLVAAQSHWFLQPQCPQKKLCTEALKDDFYQFRKRDFLFSRAIWGNLYENWVILNLINHTLINPPPLLNLICFFFRCLIFAQEGLFPHSDIYLLKTSDTGFEQGQPNLAHMAKTSTNADIKSHRANFVHWFQNTCCFCFSMKKHKPKERKSKMSARMSGSRLSALWTNVNPL